MLDTKLVLTRTFDKVKGKWKNKPTRKYLKNKQTNIDFSLNQQRINNNRKSIYLARSLRLFYALF